MNLVGILAAPFCTQSLNVITTTRVLVTALSVIMLAIAVAFSKRGSLAEEAPAARKAEVPLAQKLRIGEGAVVALVQPPSNIRKILGPLPEGVLLGEEIDDAGLILFFVRSAAALGRALPVLAPRMKRGRTLWICWPKRTSAEPCDLTLTSIRQMASPYNLVDSKVCAMDDTWSATALNKRAKLTTASKL